MSPHDFLERARSNWLASPENVFSNLEPDDADEVRALESQLIEGEFLALSDIILNCRNRFQFAKTYKTLWADLRNTLSQSGSPTVSEAKKSAIKAVFDRGIRYKLRQMATWFEIEFADASDRRQVNAGKFENAIDIYAGKEGIRSSCPLRKGSDPLRFSRFRLVVDALQRVRPLFQRAASGCAGSAILFVLGTGGLLATAFSLI